MRVFVLFPLIHVNICRRESLNASTSTRSRVQQGRPAKSQPIATRVRFRTLFLVSQDRSFTRPALSQANYRDPNPDIGVKQVRGFWTEAGRIATIGFVAASGTKSALSLQRVFPSDEVCRFLAFFSKSSELKAVVEQQLVRVSAVVDANIINAELRWRLGRRQNAASRSSLTESLDSGLLLLVAPDHLKHEIAEHLPKIASDTQVTLLAAEREWQQLQEKLRF